MRIQWLKWENIFPKKAFLYAIKTLCFFRILTSYDGSSLFEIKDFANMLTVLCVQKDETNTRNVNFSLIAYPGDSKSPQNRGFDFKGTDQEKFDFSKNQSSRYECTKVDNADRVSWDLELKSENLDGVFWSQEFNGVFCCRAVIKQQLSTACAMMRISNVSCINSSVIYCVNFSWTFFSVFLLS